MDRLNALKHFEAFIQILNTLKQISYCSCMENVFLFYETTDYKLGRRVITMVSTTDLHKWTRPKVSLRSHLIYHICSRLKKMARPI